MKQNLKSIIKNSAVLSILSVFLITLVVPVFAHPGSLDENGGHYNRKTGEYHYHAGTHTEGSNNSNSTTSYNYDYELTEAPQKTDEETTSFKTTYNPNFSSNNEIIEESTEIKTSNRYSKKMSFAEIISIFFRFLFKGAPICFLFGIAIYGGLLIIKNSIKENIILRNEIYEYRKIKYSIFPLKKQNTFLSEKLFQIEKENATNELLKFDCLQLKESFPEDVLLLSNFELKFKNVDNNHPYGKYTIYIQDHRDYLHSVKTCEYYKMAPKLSLDYSEDNNYSLCANCWHSTTMKDYPDLFMPEWYKQYKEVKDKMDKYHITATDIKKRKQEEIASLLKNSDFNIWEQEIHSKIEQVKRIKRSMDVIIISYDESTKQAIVEGAKGNEYITSFSTCTCKDFTLHKLPCKHMYKLAAIHGGIDFSKYV